MAQCANELVYRYCPQCGEYHVERSNLCRDRLCPTCAWRLSLRRYGEMTAVFSELKRQQPTLQYHMLTLTVRNVAADELRETLLLMSKAWNAITRRAAMKRAVVGWCRSIEITYNKRRRDMHPHIHIILCSRGLHGADLKWLQSAWQNALNVNYAPVCDLREIAAPDGSDDITAGVLEVFKYCTKSNDLLDMPLSEFAAYARAVRGIRLQSFGGAVKAARAALGFIDDDTAPDGEEMSLAACPECGADMCRAVLQWCGAGYAVEAVGGV